jgi:glycosyltransferase involved in cell wall biosynthesis
VKTLVISVNTAWNIYNFRRGLLRALQNEGYKIVAVSPYDSYVEKLKEMGIEHMEVKMNNKGVNPLEDIRLTIQYMKIYKKLAPTVILHYTIKPNIYGSFAAGILGIHSIANISGLGTVFLRESVTTKIAKLLYKLALKKVDKVFFQNKDDCRLFKELSLVESSKVGIVPGSGIDISFFKPIKSSRNKKNTFVFLMIARIVEDKGIREFVEAARNLKKKYRDKMTFALVGNFYQNNPSSISEEEFYKWVSEGTIEYYGATDDVRKEIVVADCIVLPSYREGLSRVLLEAAAMEKPIVTTNVPGCKDVVVDGLNGFLCQEKDAEDLLIAMEKMYNLQEKERKKMGSESRKIVTKKYSENFVISEYLKVIRSLKT